MNKSEMVERIAARTHVQSKDVAAVLDAFIDVVTRSVARGEKVVLSGFGTFHRQARARRTARNMWTDRPVRVPARSVPAFRPGTHFRDAVAHRRRPRAEG
jgi:DNA-binding protein HU-beta